MKVLDLKSKAEALNNYRRAQLVWWYEEKNGLSGPGWWGATAAMEAKGRSCVFFPAFAWELEQSQTANAAFPCLKLWDWVLADWIGSRGCFGM